MNDQDEGEHKSRLSKHSFRINNEQAMNQKNGKNTRSSSPLQFNFFTV